MDVDGCVVISSAGTNSIRKKYFYENVVLPTELGGEVGDPLA